MAGEEVIVASNVEKLPAVRLPCDRCGLWPIAAYRDHLERTVCVGCVMTAVAVARVRARRDPS